MSDPIVYTLNPTGPAAQASEALTLPLFSAQGFDLSWAIRKGGSYSKDALWMLLFPVRAVYLNSDTMSARVAATLGARSWRKIVSANPLAPNILAFEGQNGGTLYAIAGTTNVLQWVQYLLQYDQVTVGAGTGRIFSTFNDVGNGIYPSIAADYAAHGAGGPVLFLGHSLGGALADYIGKRFYQFLNKVTTGVITFGAPRVGDEDYAAWPVTQGRSSRPLFVRVFNHKDFVSHIIPTRYVRAPDGDLTGLLKVVPVVYRHTFGWTVKYDGDNLTPPQNGFLGDTDASITDSLAALRYLGSGGSMGPHAIKTYGSLIGSWTGRIQRELPYSVYHPYTVLSDDLFALDV